MFLPALILFLFRRSDTQVGTRVCYVKYDDTTSVGVALHLTNTVFIDRALIIVPVMDGKIFIFPWPWVDLDLFYGKIKFGFFGFCSAGNSVK